MRETFPLVERQGMLPKYINPAKIPSQSHFGLVHWTAQESLYS
jgi:hypothetical protein